MVSAHKEPPPETQHAVRRRFMTILSFWAVILFLGLPMWWKTTSVYRSQLSFGQMTNIPHQLLIPLDIQVSSTSLTSTETSQLVKTLQQTLDDLNEYPVIHQRIRGAEHERVIKNTKDEDAALRIVLESGPQFRHKLHEDYGGKPMLEVQYSSSTGSELTEYLAKRVQEIFWEEHISAARQYVLHSSNASPAEKFVQSAPAQLVQEVERRDGRAFKYSGHYHLIFSLFTASGRPSEWDIETALKHHISPLVAALSTTSNFSVTSQIQLYSSFSPSVHPETTPSGDGFVLKRNELSGFINAAEWPLSPSIGDGPTINFILYVPSKEQFPLSIENSSSNSWLIPQWGGIVILNPPLESRSGNGEKSIPLHLQSKSLAQPFEQFASQLLSLLGVPANDLPLSLRLDSHQRITGLSLFLRASSSLGSLARLASHLASIPIPKHVSLLVEATLDRLAAAATYFSTVEFEQGIRQAYAAFLNAEKAFFDKSMVGQVYFPSEHRIAVYLPLIGPIGVPLAVALLRELKTAFSWR